MAKKRNYKKEYREYHGTPKQRARRAARNRARRKMEKRVGKARLRGKDVDHKDGNPKNNSARNLRAVSRGRNRGFRRDSKNRNLGLRRKR